MTKKRVQDLTDIMARVLHYQDHGEPNWSEMDYAATKREYDALPKPIIDRYMNDAKFHAQVQRAVAMLLELDRGESEPGAERCPARWEVANSVSIPCTLPAGHTGKHRAPEPFAQEDSLLGVTRYQMDFTTAVVGNAFESGMTKEQFLTMVNIAWDARKVARDSLNRGASHE